MGTTRIAKYETGLRVKRGTGAAGVGRTPLAGVLIALVLTACAGNPATSTSSDDSSGSSATDGSGDPDLVDIGGRSLFFHCEGATGPTVLLEAGLTGDHRTWESVIPGLPADTRVCAYDRANIAPSDLASKPRTAQDAVDDLEALLDAAEEPAPYVMVGFSFGGIITQLYAAEHPDDIAALVLVESNHPDEADLFAAHLTPDQIAADHAEADANPEGIDIFGSLEQVQAAGPLPQVPLVVVTATESIEWPPGWDAALFGQLRGQLQADLATLVPGGTQVFADGSGHQVPQERPAVVIDAITSVLPGQ